MDSRLAPQACPDADKVRKLIAEYLGFDTKRVIDEAHLNDDLGLDWLDQLELMALIEEEFPGVAFFSNSTAHIESVGDLIRHIEHHNVALACRSEA